MVRAITAKRRIRCCQLVRYVQRLLFQLAEVLVTGEVMDGMMERISWLRLAPG